MASIRCPFGAASCLALFGSHQTWFELSFGLPTRPEKRAFRVSSSRASTYTGSGLLFEGVSCFCLPGFALFREFEEVVGPLRDLGVF